MMRAFVSVGSNIEPAVHVASAIRELSRKVEVVRISTVYRTRPENRPEQGDFYNCTVEIDASVSPEVLKFQILRGIEAELGRARSPDKDASRTIDLDLLLYGDLAVHKAGLVLPDPDLARRAFLAVPLSELAPDLILPGTGLTVSEVAARLPLKGMQPLEDYTAGIRCEFEHVGAPPHSSFLSR